MNFIPKHKYLQMNANTLEKVRRDVNLHRPGEMKEAVRILHEWIQQQPHFKKKNFPFHYLEIIIVSSKGSLERAKGVIDSACTLRTLMPNIFAPINLKESFQSVWEEGYYVLLPKLTPDNCRIVIFRMVGKFKNAENIDFAYKYGCMFSEYVQMHDYYSKVIIVYDLTDMDLGDTLTKLNLVKLKNILLSWMDASGMRLKTFHIITKSKLIEKTLAFFRPFIKSKMINRIVVNQTAEDLHHCYPRNILPQDYGGNEKTLSDLHDECLNMISTNEHLEDAKSMFEAQVDESLRPQGQFNELYAGTEGSFRTLTLD